MKSRHFSFFSGRLTTANQQRWRRTTDLASDEWLSSERFAVRNREHGQAVVVRDVCLDAGDRHAEGITISALPVVPGEPEFPKISAAAGRSLPGLPEEGRERSPVTFIWILLAVVGVWVVVHFAWRWGSRRWSLPCPTALAWTLESPLFQRLSGTETTLTRLGLRPGLRILEIGPGPGRLLLPAASRILPGGEAVGIDIQPGMIERLKLRAEKAGVTNLTALLGDATQPHVAEASFDLVFLCTALGEIPDRATVLSQCHRALKPGGMLSITEKFGDPHYQSRSTVKRLAEEVGFRLQSIEGKWWFFTANLIKP